HGVVPGQAASLLEGSMKTLTQHKGTSITVLSIGGVLAVWSLTGAMQNLMWAFNIAYERDEGRGFIRRRLTALWMVVFALIGFALAFGVLVLGPHLSTWIGDALGAKTVVKVVWYVAEWPLLVAGLLVAFAGLMHYGPNVKHPRWRFLTFGSVLAIVIWLAASHSGINHQPSSSRRSGAVELASRDGNDHHRSGGEQGKGRRARQVPGRRRQPCAEAERRLLRRPHDQDQLAAPRLRQQELQ